MKMNVHIGALVPRLGEQAEAQGLRFTSEEKRADAQRIHDALVTLAIRNILPAGVRASAHKKFVKLVLACVEPNPDATPDSDGGM